MTMGSQQLAEDYAQLKELIELYPNISIIKVEGQPPDKYELEYRLRGFIKNDSGTVDIGDAHRVRISLPFGYPHFAPIAKPLTPIFHPDIDPAAIRIADHWQQNPSMPDLVLLIGEMICGNVFNLDAPFNQDAADWYTANKDKLPLDSLSIADIVESGEEFDTLADDTFASLGLESDDFLEPERPVTEEDLQQIRDLLAQNKVFTANKRLIEMLDKVDIPDLDAMQQEISKVLRKTDQLFKLAEQLEDLGKFGEAMEVVDNLMAIAADAPGAASLRERMQQAYLLAPQGKTPPPKQDINQIETKSKPAAKQSELAPPRLKGKRAWPTFSFPFKPVLLAIVLLGLCIGAISLYLKDQNVISRSQANLLQSKLLSEKRQFDTALQLLETAKDSLADLTVLRFRKDKLNQEIETAIAAPVLQEGLKGRVLHEGQYLPVRTVEALGELTALTDQAQALVSQNKLDEALAIYRKALQHASKHDLETQKALITNYIKSVELRNALGAAEKAEQAKDWRAAADAYRTALALSGELTNLGSASDITHRLTAAAFRHEFDQSKKAFSQSQWQETIAFLQQAQQAITANPDVVTAKERQDLHQLLVNARLYSTLSVAREAYQNKNWDVAIKEYQNALELLAQEPGNIGESLNESIAKIEKTLLMVKIAQLQDKVLLAEGKKDLPKVVEHNRGIQKLIRASSHANDSAVKTVMQKVTEQIDKNLDQIAKNEKIAWLESHFEEIFRANYPTFSGSKLVQPKAVFLKKVDNKSIFTITCIERSQGSSSKLELNYMVDEETGKWSVYTGK